MHGLLAGVLSGCSAGKDPCLDKGNYLSEKHSSANMPDCVVSGSSYRLLHRVRRSALSEI